MPPVQIGHAWIIPAGFLCVGIYGLMELIRYLGLDHMLLSFVLGQVQNTLLKQAHRCME